MSDRFMAVIDQCLQATGHDPLFIIAVRDSVDRIAAQRPDLVERYDRAAVNRDSAEIERLLLTCQAMLADDDDVWIGNLRVNAVTGRFHVGDGNRSTPVFPAG